MNRPIGVTLLPWGRPGRPLQVWRVPLFLGVVSWRSSEKCHSLKPNGVRRYGR